MVGDFWRRRSVGEVEAGTMAQQNGCSMDLAVEEDGLEGAVDGVVVDGSAAINGHTSAAAAEVDGAAASAGPSSSAPAISRVDRDVIRLIAQHLQNLGLKYDHFFRVAAYILAVTVRISRSGYSITESSTDPPAVPPTNWNQRVQLITDLLAYLWMKYMAGTMACC